MPNKTVHAKADVARLRQIEVLVGQGSKKFSVVARSAQRQLTAGCPMRSTV